MPGGDGRGPGGFGQGRGTGSNNPGPGGYCVCPNCGTKTEHQRGMPCNSQNCPKCGAKMMRS